MAATGSGQHHYSVPSHYPGLGLCMVTACFGSAELPIEPAIQYAQARHWARGQLQ